MIEHGKITRMDKEYTPQTKKTPETSAPSRDMLQDDSILLDGPSVEESSINAVGTSDKNMQFKYFSNEPAKI